MAALGQSPSPAQIGGIEVRQVLKDGNLIAVLMAIDGGDTFTVVSEVHANGPENVRRRPYTFPNADAGLAFMTEAVTSFTYLGCEVRQQ